MTKYRTFGWIQNPSDFSKLKKAVQIFDPKSEQYKRLSNHTIRQVIYSKEDQEYFQNKLAEKESVFSYGDLVGSSKNKDGKSPPKTQ